MKPGIHPEYHATTARCACGASWTVHSTKKDVHLDVCNQCHPFFTGRQKLLDTEGRITRFSKKFGAQTVDALKAANKAKKDAKVTKTKTN